MESNNFEDAIQLAVSLNTDSPDTLGGMVGAIAEAFYGDYFFTESIRNYLPIEMKRIMCRFSLRFGDGQ